MAAISENTSNNSIEKNDFEKEKISIIGKTLF